MKARRAFTLIELPGRIAGVLVPALLILAAASCAAPPAPQQVQVPDLPPVTLHAPPQHEAVEIVRDGQPVAQVCVAVAKPSANLQRLARELVEVVKLSTGAELTVVDAPPAADLAAIVIGDCEESRKLGIEAAEIPFEGFVVRTAPNRVFLVGSTRALPPNVGMSDPYANDGTAWAVADFLERFVGVRWYWPVEAGGRSIVKAASITVPPTHYSDQPVFRMRVHWPPGYKKPWRSRWFDKQHPQMPPVALPPDVQAIDMAPLLSCLRAGNSWPYLIKVHQPQHFASNPKAWEAHKGMFQQNKDGTPNYRMLCYSSQETFDYLMKGCEDVWTHGKAPAAVPWVTTTCVTISPGDYPVNCHCEECRKLHNPLALRCGMASGSASRILGTFLKKFCAEVERRWPDKKVLFLAYWNYALCPADIEFPDNLEVQMCTTGFASLRQPVLRACIEHNLRAWSEKVGGRITTWEYSNWITNWTHGSLQFPHLVQDYYRANRDTVAGTFINGESFPEWSRAAPTLYCWMRVLWNPEVDVDAILDEMCTRMFGKGAGTARELLRLMCDRWEKAQWHSTLGASGHISPAIFSDTWPPQVVAKMDELRRKAREEMKDDPVALQRFEYWTWTFDAFLKEAQQEWEKAGRKAQ